MPAIRILTSLVLLALLAPAACDRTEVENEEPARQPAPASTQIGRAKFKRDSGEEAFTFKPKLDGAKLEGPQGEELARYTGGPEKLEIKDAGDVKLGQVVLKANRLELQDPQGAALFRIQRQEDGDFKLEGAERELLVRIKRRDYGWELEDPDKRTLAKAKLKEDKSSLRDAQDRTLFATKDPVSTLAVALLGLDRLSLPQRGALFVLIQMGADRKLEASR